MIINIRGTSGAGKTHLARRVMELYSSRTVFRKAGRKQPLGYVYGRSGPGRPLAVVGHYESPCGGCDTIVDTSEIFDLVKQSAMQGFDVLFEGLLISADVNRHTELHQWCQEHHEELLIVALDTELEECLSSVNARRHARNPDLPPVNPKNTTTKHAGVRRSLERLGDAGVRHVTASREEAFRLIREELGV